MTKRSGATKEFHHKVILLREQVDDLMTQEVALLRNPLDLAGVVLVLVNVLGPLTNNAC